MTTKIQKVQQVLQDLREEWAPMGTGCGEGLLDLKLIGAETVRPSFNIALNAIENDQQTIRSFLYRWVKEELPSIKPKIEALENV